MNNVERFRKVMNFEKTDRLPIIEWAHWWNQTLDKWHKEGLSEELKDAGEIRDFLGLDCYRQLWLSCITQNCPSPAYHGAPIIKNEADYERILPNLYPEDAFDKEMYHRYAERHKKGEMVIWFSLEGYFWHPRVLFGIEPHMYAFYDNEKLMKRINEDLLKFHQKVIDELCEICVPDFMTFAEDMSFNKGPMLSKACFDEFLLPYYLRVTPMLKDKGIIPFVDSDGNVEPLIPWLIEAGIEGILPLERMAGVDVAKIRADHPDFKMVGAFDKTVMHLGEEAVRTEFERLLPTMRTGGFIASVDHQTPPAVSLNDYQLYLKLLEEYCIKAMNWPLMLLIMKKPFVIVAITQYTLVLHIA